MKAPQPETRPESGDDPEQQTPDDERSAPDYVELLGQFADEARGVGRDVADLLRVGIDQVRLEARERGFRLIVMLWLAIVVVVVTVLAALFLVDGTSGLLTEIFNGRAWAGQLATGVLVLGSIAVALGLLRVRSRRMELKRLKSKYAATDSERDRGERP